ncbi:forkhead box protein D3-like [Sceloporus undulatus]|uniref:forkhead box protein D3-like n=1 Tax=Sceloporus undulatus TaxID=8520 RepID=UPI001C4DA164|nr:forkhead box protein D3-like [Sceloporus undulatus]
MEGAEGEAQKPPGVSFTIDYLLFDKGKPTRRDPEPSGQVEPEEGRNNNEIETPRAGMSPDLLDKPNQSYIALISTAILSSPEKKLLLSDIYQWIMDKYPYFKNKEKSWRNSVRHNLSLNECFVKAGRSENGKGHFWAIHPANLEDFSKGDYHRRRARRRIRRMAVNFGYYHPYAFYGLGCCPPGRYCLCCPPYAHPGITIPPHPPAFPPLLLPTAGASWPHPFLVGKTDKPQGEKRHSWATWSRSHLQVTQVPTHANL